MDQTSPPARSPWPRRLRRLAIDLVLVGAVLWAVSWWRTRDLLPDDAPAPALSLPTLTGEAVSLEDARGRPTVLYFFAPWCTVCDLASSNLVALRDARPEAGLAIYAVALSYEDPAEVRRFATEHALNVPVLLGDAATASAWRVSAFPTFYVLDADGRVTSRTVGYTTELGLRLRAL